MAIKLKNEYVKMVLFWGAYLTGTMILFERTGVTPEAVGGVAGWFLVEVLRAIIGYWMAIKFFGERR